MSRKGGRPPARSGSLDALLIAALLAFGVLLPLFVSVIAGTLEIPRNDDWSYRRIATSMATTGKLTLDGISSTLIVGQVLLTQPLLWLSGLEPSAFAVAGVVFAIGGMVSSYALARRILPPAEAALSAGLLAIFPGYLAYATSFMSDVPALAAQFACLVLGAMALHERPARTGWFVASLIAGIVAFSIREFAIAGLASVAFVVIVAEPRRWRHWFLSSIAVGICVALYVWRTSLPGQVPPVGPGYGSVMGVLAAISSVAFFIAPAALVSAGRWRGQMRRIDLAIGLAIGAALVVARMVVWANEGPGSSIFLQNLTSPFGVPAGGYTVGARPLLFDLLVWGIVNGVAIATTLVVPMITAGVVGLYLRRMNSPGRGALARVHSAPLILVVFVVAVMGGLAAFGLSRPLFDRYLWPVIPPLAALLLYVPPGMERTAYPSTSRGQPVAAAAIAVMLGAISVVYLLNSHAFDAARWAAGGRLAEAGIPADRIDAGYEWVGYHATTPGDPTIRTSTETFYRSWWPDFVPCRIVSSQPLDRPNTPLVETTEYRLNLIVGPMAPLYLYRVVSPECDG